MTRPSSVDVLWHEAAISRSRREARNAHQGGVVWMTGLSGAGKSTSAHGTDEALFNRGYSSYVLDGDNVRHGLCGDLGFSREDRQENIRRIAEVARLFVDAGIIVLAAFAVPRGSRSRPGAAHYQQLSEVHCACSQDVCEQRDTKGLYRRARKGLISEFTGVSSPYEVPPNPDLSIDTGVLSVAEGVDRILALLIERQIVPTLLPHDR